MALLKLVNIDKKYVIFDSSQIVSIDSDVIYPDITHVKLGGGVTHKFYMGFHQLVDEIYRQEGRADILNMVKQLEKLTKGGGL